MPSRCAILPALLLLAGCHSVIVWRAEDIIFFGLLGIIIGLGLLLFAFAALCDALRWVGKKLFGSGKTDA